MEFVDEENGVGGFFDEADDGLDTPFHLAAKFGAGHESGHVDGIEFRIAQGGGNFTEGYFSGKSFDDGGFSDAGLSHDEDIAFGTPQQRATTGVDFAIAPHDGIDVSLTCFFDKPGDIGFDP